MNDTVSPLLPTPPLSDGFETGMYPADSAPSTALQPSNLPPLLCQPRHRRGNIARLPKPTRDQINQMLDDGYPYAAICQHLAQNGTDISEDSLGRWKKGGYQDYRRELRLLDQSRLRYELTLDLARDLKGIDVYQAALKISAAQICDAVAEIGPDSLRRAVQENPLNLLRMLNALARLTAGGLECESLQQDLREPAGALRPETLARIEKELNLL
jgi:hypothetical protein